MTDYDPSSKQHHSDPFFKVGLNDRVEKRKHSSSDETATAVTNIKKKDGFVESSDHASEDVVFSKINTEPATTPRNNGFFVNLSDGSGKMSTRYFILFFSMGNSMLKHQNCGVFNFPA